MAVNNRTYQFYKERLKAYKAPYLVLDKAYYELNIKMQEERLAGRPIRIASKSIRSPDLILSLLKRSPQYIGVMGYKYCESKYLLENGLKDLLMGYPLSDKEEIKSLASFGEKDVSVCFMVDCKEHLQLLDKAAEELNIPLSFCLDMDMSTSYPGLHFGVHRSPVRTLDDLRAFLDISSSFSRLKFIGLMGYEAQLAGVPDRMPGKPLQSMVLPFLKRHSAKQVKQKRAEAVKLIRSRGLKLSLINGGGTGSIEYTREEEDITEITVGSGYLGGHLFDHYSAFKPYPAMFFALSVSRRPSRDCFTCQGGPFNASGFSDPSKAPIPYLPLGGRLDKNEGLGEVQTPLFFSTDSDLRIGDPVFFRHAKSGEPGQFFQYIILLEDSQLSIRKTFAGLGLG